MKLEDVKPFYFKSRNCWRIDVRSVEPKLWQQETFDCKTEEKAKEKLKQMISQVPIHYREKFNYTLVELWKEFKAEEIPGVPDKANPEILHYKLDQYNKITRIETLLSQKVLGKTFGNWFVRNVDAAIVQKEIVNKLSETRTKKTVSNYVNNFATLLDFAVTESVIKFNPIRVGEGKSAKTLVKIKGLPSKKKAAARKIHPQVINKLIDSTDKVFWKAAVAFAAWTGARLGEQRAITWGDIDFENSLVRIKSTVFNPKIKDDKGWITETKIRHTTKASELREDDPGERLIALIPDVSMFLKALWGETKYKGKGDLVFGSRSGQIHSEARFREFLHAATKAAGVEYINWHLLRHHFASLCIAEKFEPESLCAIMGHADISITMRIYGHEFKTENQVEDMRKKMAGIGGYSQPMAVNENPYNFSQK